MSFSSEIEAGAEGMADDVWGWCEQAKAFGRTVTVKVKFADFHQITRSRSLPTPVARRDLLRQLSVDLVRTVLPTPKGVRLIGVTLSNFERPITTVPELPLFPSEDTSSCDNDG